MKYRIFPIAIPLAGLATLAACNSETAPVPNDGAQAPAAVPDIATEPDAAPTPPAAGNAIPLALQGVWNLDAADCANAVSEGRLEIGAQSLEFYESRAALGTIESVDATSITANYDFTGEGQTWQRVIELKTTSEGKTLLRQVRAEGAQQARFQYSRC